jgi:outer membrane biosynthesis protein TonB
VVSRDLAGSLGLHVGLALLVGLWTPFLQRPDLIDQSLPVDIITVEEFTRLLEAPEPQEPTPPPEVAAPEVRAPDATQAPPDAMPELEAKKPEPEKPQDKPKETAPQRFKVASPTPLARPAREPKPLLDIGQVQALLNKTPDAPKPQPQVNDTQEEAVGARLTLNEVDAFRAQMRRCWSPPAGAREAENLVVLVRLSLTPAGMISAGPVVANRRQLGDPFFRAAAESVLRAILRCQPFSMPVEKYQAWRNIELTFDPRRMLGG